MAQHDSITQSERNIVTVLIGAMPIVALRTEMEILNRPNPVGDFSPPYQIPTWLYICFYKLSYAFNSVTAPGSPLFLSLLYYCGCQRVTQYHWRLFISVFIHLFIYSFIHCWLFDLIQSTRSCETSAY